MNRKQYNSDSRYRKVLEQMDLLGIMDITTKRQEKNGTIVWRLPIKNAWKNGKQIEVASFETGYVRNQNSGYSNYQLNKRKKYSEYHKYNTDGFENPQTAYYKVDHYSRILIPIEIERLEYLISYCLKNYYIKNANSVAEGKYISKWIFDNANETYEESDYRIQDLERMLDGYKKREKDLENKLDRSEFYPFDLQVLVNGQRYKVI